MYCPGCGREIQPGARFCGKCGRDLFADAQTPNPRPAPYDQTDQYTQQNLYPDPVPRPRGAVMRYIYAGVSVVFILMTLVPWISTFLTDIPYLSAVFSSARGSLPKLAIDFFNMGVRLTSLDYSDAQTSGGILFGFAAALAVLWTVMVVLLGRQAYLDFVGKENGHGGFLAFAIVALVVIVVCYIVNIRVIQVISEQLYTDYYSLMVDAVTATGWTWASLILGAGAFAFTRIERSHPIAF